MFSIIVPVYNVERYLSKCIDSIIVQNAHDFEVLLIDDGSTDSSSQLCDQYSAAYSFIHVFHKKNGGLSDARNYGINRSKGDYLVFIDSDDWIADNALQVFSTILNEKPADVLITRLTEVFPDRVVQKDLAFKGFLQEPLSKDRAIKWEMKRSQNSWPAPKTIVSRRLVEDNQIRFATGMLHEDMGWTAEICLHAESFIGSGIEWYYHRMMREGSITNTIKGKNVSDTIQLASAFFQKTENDHSHTAKMIRNRMMNSVYAKLNELKKCTIEEQEEVTRIVQDNMKIFSVAPAMRHKLFSFTMRLIGPKAALHILNRIQG